MSALVYLTGSVAGVTLAGPGGVGLKASLVGRGALISARAINIRQPADPDGEPYIQSAAVTKNIPFGIRFEELDVDFFNDSVDAILAAMDSHSPFEVDVQDDISTVTVQALVAGSNWLLMPDDRRTNPITIKGPIIYNFLTAGEIES